VQAALDALDLGRSKAAHVARPMQKAQSLLQKL
jgi:hypothetical protein